MASGDNNEILRQLLADVIQQATRDTTPDLPGEVRRALTGSSGTGREASSEAAEPRPLAVTVNPDPDGQSSQLARQMAELTGVAQAQSDGIAQNTQAVIENSIAAASGGAKGVAASIGKTALSFFGRGVGLISLISKLFDGGTEETAPALVRYSLPAPVNLEAGLSPLTGIQPIRYASDGLAHAVPSTPPAAPSPVTIQVQAMDSRSFLDHSAEIAQAVREALLHSHALSDVVQEL